MVIVRKAGLSVFLALLSLVVCLTARHGDAPSHAHPYGVFLGATPEDLAGFADYRMLVLDLTYFSADHVKLLKEAGHIVYTYLNIGSVETFRDYYADFEPYTLGEYENWPEERLMDTGRKEWQDFIADTLAVELSQKGADGFFIDNTDVYYYYKKEGIYRGITAILTRLARIGLPLMINGGDAWVNLAMQNGDISLISGVNQECVLTRIDFAKEAFYAQTAQDRAYFVEYLTKCREFGLAIYVLEYSADQELTQTARRFSTENGYICYVSPNLSLIPDQEH